MEHEKLNELIKQAVGTRSLRQVEEESGISHGLLGKVLNNTQKASVDAKTVREAEKKAKSTGKTAGKYGKKTIKSLLSIILTLNLIITYNKELY